MGRSHGYDVLSTASGGGVSVHRTPLRPAIPAAAEPQGARLQARPRAAGRWPRGRGAGDRRRGRRRALALGLPRLAEMVTRIDQAVARAKASPEPATAFQREVAEIQ